MSELKITLIRQLQFTTGEEILSPAVKEHQPRIADKLAEPGVLENLERKGFIEEAFHLIGQLEPQHQARALTPRNLYHLVANHTTNFSTLDMIEKLEPTYPILTPEIVHNIVRRWPRTGLIAVMDKVSPERLKDILNPFGTASKDQILSGFTLTHLWRNGYGSEAYELIHQKLPSEDEVMLVSIPYAFQKGSNVWSQTFFKDGNNQDSVCINLYDPFTGTKINGVRTRPSGDPALQAYINECAFIPVSENDNREIISRYLESEQARRPFYSSARNEMETGEVFFTSKTRPSHLCRK